MPATSESSINAPSVVRGVRSHRANASTSSLSPLLSTDDWEDADSSEAIMDSEDLKRTGSKTHQENNEDMSGPEGYDLSGLNLAETEGRVGFWGLFQNTLV